MPPLLLLRYSIGIRTHEVLAHRHSSQSLLAIDRYPISSSSSSRFKKYISNLMGILSKSISSTSSSSGSSSSLSLHQMLPWWGCFHHMHLPSSSSSKPTGNSSSPSPGAVRLIESDGRVKVFKHPVPASEVMRQHPLHLICRSDTFFIGQKVPALPPTEHLQPGHSYFLLPSHFFHSVLSFLTLSSNKDTSAILRSFDITRTDKGMLQVRVKDDDMMSDGEDRSCDDDDQKSAAAAARLRVCSSEELEKEYRQLVGYCRARRWKPRLETVTEASLKTRRISSSVHVMLLLMISRRNKKKVQA